MKTRAILVGLAVIAAVALPHGASAHHPPQTPPVDYVIKAGGHDPDNVLAPWSNTKFYPSRIQVHRGQTVAWEFDHSFAGLHTIHFEVKDGRSVLDPDNLPYTIRRDEAPGSIALNEAGWIFGSENGRLGPSCGRLGQVPFDRGPSVQQPCDLTADGTVSSGLSDQFTSGYRGKDDRRGFIEFPAFGITFGEDLESGDFVYACKYHPGMTGVVEVVDDTVPIATKEQVLEQGRQELRADTEVARAYFAERNVQSPPTVDDNGDRVWRVQVGGETAEGEANFIHYFPSTLTGVRPGDVVEFEVEGDEWQSVTFPTDIVGGLNIDGECSAAHCSGTGIPWGLFLTTFPWGCEYDAPADGLPHLTTHVPTRGCPEGSLLEWVFGPTTVTGQRAPGDIVATRATYHNSGLMLSESLPDWARYHPYGEWPSKFRARFPVPGTFSFTCLIHPQAMKGTITVE